MRSKPVHTVITHCLKTVSALPVEEQALLYRGLAECCGCPQENAKYLQIAESLETAQKLSRQLAFSINEEVA